MKKADRDAFDEIARRTGATREEVIAVWEERAAIREYLGGQCTFEAERLAFQDAERVLTRQGEIFDDQANEPTRRGRRNDR